MSADGSDAAGASTDDAPVAGTGAVKVRVTDVRKRFGRVLALDDVSLEVYENEIFALVGDNGAGKSTLMNVLSGVFPPSDGSVHLDGEEVHFTNPSDARANGVETVYQDLALMNDLDIATNVFVGSFPTVGAGPLTFIDWDETYERAADIVHGQLGRDEMDIRTDVEFLSGGQRQLVAVARALAFDPDVIILDEPTSALSVDASRLVYRTIERLKEEGITVVIVSHSIDDVLRFSDRIAVLYQGSLAEVTTPESADLETITNLMTTGSRNPGQE